MKDLAIYGAGGFGREIAMMVEQINAVSKQWKLLGFFDDEKKKDLVIDELPVLGNMEDLNSLNTPLSVAIAIAEPATRQSIVSRITNDKITFPILVHPVALKGSRHNRFGKGCIVTAGCIFTTGISLDDFVIVNLSTTVGHDVTIGKFASVMPGCNISGNVSIGEGTLIGTGVQVLQNLSIGNNCKIGAGAVITKNFKDGVTVVGIPGKTKER